MYKSCEMVGYGSFDLAFDPKTKMHARLCLIRITLLAGTKRRYSLQLSKSLYTPFPLPERERHIWYIPECLV